MRSVNGADDERTVDQLDHDGRKWRLQTDGAAAGIKRRRDGR